MEFGKNFVRLIGMHGLTSSAAARVLEISSQTISSWVRGHSNPSTPVVMAVSSFFEVPADRLFGAPFAELLEVLADQDRYARVEEKIEQRLGMTAASKS